MGLLRKDVDISTKLAGVKLASPTILASGILGTTPEIMERASGFMMGAVTTKSIGYEVREGNPNPTVMDLGYGMINAVGLPNPGFTNIEDSYFENLGKIKSKIIVSVFGRTPEQFGEVASYMAARCPDFIELNLSCPNVEGMTFAQDADLSAAIVKKVKSMVDKIPIIAKLTPNVADIAGVAKACEEAGADIICAINTVGPGMVINIDAKKPVLGFGRGGLSGPAIKPIAVRCVYDIYKAVKIPIIGTGGISTGRDAIEMLMAGASAIGIGTAAKKIENLEKIVIEMKEWLKENNLKVKDIIGCAHG